MHWSSCWKRGSCIFHSKITPNPFFKKTVLQIDALQIQKWGEKKKDYTQVKPWRPGGDEPRLGNQTAGERSRTKGVIDETMFHSLDCARGRVSPGADTRCTASHRDLITAALTSANRLWNMERNSARPCPCEAVGGAGTKLQLLASSRKVLPSRRPLLLAGYVSDSPHPNLGPYTLKKFPWWAF